MNLKITTRIVGALFLIQMIAAVISHSTILAPILRGNDFLVKVAANESNVILAALLDLVTGAAVFGISTLLFPILKKHSESIALWYAGLRLNEWVATVISGVFLLTIISISKEYAQASMPESSDLQSLGKYILKARNMTKILMLLGYCLSAVLFYFLLYRSRLLPRFISIWGLVGVLLLFIEIMSNIYGNSVGGIKIMLPLGLNELCLGVWLIVKGFNQAALAVEWVESEAHGKSR